MKTVAEKIDLMNLSSIGTCMFTCETMPQFSILEFQYNSTTWPSSIFLHLLGVAFVFVNQKCVRPVEKLLGCLLTSGRK